MLKPTLILCHGYGLTPSYWHHLLPYFSDYEIINLNLGYFGDPPPLHENLENKKIFALGHSLGWAKLENLELPLLASVGLQAFRDFCGYEPKLRQKRMEELQQLQQMFDRNPKSCLRYFYQRAGLPNFWSSTSKANLALLAHDLEQLHIEFKLMANHPKLIIATQDDPIVSPELILDNFDKQAWVDYIWLAQGQHALGFNQPEIIAPIIRDFFNAHQQN